MTSSKTAAWVYGCVRVILFFDCLVVFVRMTAADLTVQWHLTVSVMQLSLQYIYYFDRLSFYSKHTLFCLFNNDSVIKFFFFSLLHCCFLPLTTIGNNTAADVLCPEYCKTQFPVYRRSCSILLVGRLFKKASWRILVYVSSKC